MKIFIVLITYFILIFSSFGDEIDNKGLVCKYNTEIKNRPHEYYWFLDGQVYKVWYDINESIIKKSAYPAYYKITDNYNIPKLFSPPISKNKKIKVGFASSIFRKHTITKLFKNWIIKLDKDKFDVYIVDLESEKDEIYNEINNNSVETILTNGNLEENINFIRTKKLDYIIYTVTKFYEE